MNPVLLCLAQIGADFIRSALVGARADLAIWDISGIESAGSWDPAALLLAGPAHVRDLFVEGRQVVRDGHLTTIDLGAAIGRQNELAKRLSGPV